MSSDSVSETSPASSLVGAAEGAAEGAPGGSEVSDVAGRTTLRRTFVVVVVGSGWWAVVDGDGCQR